MYTSRSGDNNLANTVDPEFRLSSSPRCCWLRMNVFGVNLPKKCPRWTAWDYTLCVSFAICSFWCIGLKKKKVKPCILLPPFGRFKKTRHPELHTCTHSSSFRIWSNESHWWCACAAAPPLRGYAWSASSRLPAVWHSYGFLPASNSAEGIHSQTRSPGDPGRTQKTGNIEISSTQKPTMKMTSGS